MECGQHFLEGSIVDLKSPFMVLEKVTDHDGEGGEINGTGRTNILGFAKSKIIFNTRPKPLGLKRVLGSS